MSSHFGEMTVRYFGPPGFRISGIACLRCAKPGNPAEFVRGLDTPGLLRRNLSIEL